MGRTISVEAAEAFLNAAHGFDNSKAKCNKRTTFATVLDTAIRGGITNKSELMTDFGFTKAQVDAAKSGQSVGIDAENRAKLIGILKDRALEVAN
jgi:hypothetical protein